jgi:signal transduction histidine kinase
MHKRSILIYWLILFIPTLAIGVAAFYLLRHESERMAQAAHTSAYENASVLAETLQTSIVAMEDELSKAMQDIPKDKLQTTLFDWEEHNPLIRNVFIWKPGVGLLYPQPSGPSSSEQARFMTRYNTIFSNKDSWYASSSERSETVASDNGSSGQQDSFLKDSALTQTQSVQKSQSSRKELISLAKSSSKEKTADQKAAGQNNGWIPWFSENNLYVLGWSREDASGNIYGVELELMTILSRLLADFPATVPHGVVYTLLDGQGNNLHQSGDAILEKNKKPEMTISLTPNLPNWQIAVYFVEGGPAAQSTRGFIILTGLLLAIFVAAVILGGSFLIWQAHRNMMDAQQKTSFVSNVSHELKTPLTTIRMYTELLSADRIKEPEKKKKYLQVILAESERLTRLVNNVLDFSRLEQGRKRYRLETLDLAAFLRELLVSQRPRTREAGLEIQEQIPAEPALVPIDRDAIEQVILNILDNAVKYAAQGAEILIALDLDTHYYRLRIMDRGPGVPPGQRSSIFNKFYRVDDSLSAKQSGSGLGLSIARGLMRGMGGDLLYEARDGGGSCFIVLIPCGSQEKS